MKESRSCSLQNRRTFLRLSSGALGAAALSNLHISAIPAPKQTAVDLVPFGNQGMKICRVGIGTGTNGGAVQRNLGQKAFSNLLRSAYDRGITYIDTADAYGTHVMVGKAIQGLPREKLWIQTKIPWEKPEFREKTLETLDRYRRELDVEYIDSLLIHCTTKVSWPEELARMMDSLSEAKQKGLIRMKGVSCHGLAPLTAATQANWVDVHLVRVNPQGRYVDGPKGEWDEKGDVQTVINEMRKMHAEGRGVIGMKLIGNGDFTNPEDREKSIRYAVACDCLDSMVIGFKNEAEIDEALSRVNNALNNAKAA